MNKKPSLKIALLYSLGFFCAFFLIILVAGIVGFTFGLIKKDLGRYNGITFICAIFLSCIIVGTLVYYASIKRITNNLVKFQNDIDRVAKGDFDVKFQLGSKFEQPEYIDDLNLMVSELKKNQLLKNDFISSFSHEFKTPIVSIRGYAELMLEDESITKEEREKYLNIIVDESKRLSNLANETLLMQKLDSSDMLIDQTNVNIKDVVDQAYLLLKQELGKNNVVVKYDINDFYYNGNKDMLKEVMINIINNSIKYKKDNAILEISSYEDSQSYILTFKDNGRGIKSEDLEHIFDKYYQSDKSKHDKGIGLGLAITKRILDLHKASIECKSVYNEGTLFNITFPKKRQ